MGKVEDRLTELSLELPAPLAPVGTYEAVKLHGGIAYVAGHAPMDAGSVIMTGVLGDDLTVEDGYRAAR